MMKTKYTKGPWEAGRPDMATVVDGYDSKWVYAGEKYIAVASGRDVEAWEEVMANARLIAAAPDLLDVCERAASEDRAWGFVRAHAIRAIGKAKGG